MPTKSNNIGGRGGARPGAGRKPKSLKTVDAAPLPRPKMEGVDMPKPRDFLAAKQADGGQMQAQDIYAETWSWLQKFGCSDWVSPQLLERYAVCLARWIQCEEAISLLGFLSPHPTTGATIASPYINIGIQYLNQANRLWDEIYQLIEQKSGSACGSANLQEDSMERLLHSR